MSHLLDLEEKIGFHTEKLSFQLKHQELIRKWIDLVIQQQACQLIGLNFIFCSDAYLHQINMEYLQHDTFTDIITFPYLEKPNIEGDIFISIERVEENAKQYQVTFDKELHRVMIHGVLHLCGQLDKTEAEQKEMRAKEDEALFLLC